MSWDERAGNRLGSPLRALVLGLLLCAPTLWLRTAQAGTVTLLGPEGFDVLPTLDVYAEAEAGRLPVANLTGWDAVTLPAGRYSLGVSGFPARGRAFELGANEDKVVELAGLEFPAPAGAAARFALFSEEDDHRLTAIIELPTDDGGRLLLPPGDYLVRRDLGVEAFEVTLGAGEVTTVALGSFEVRPISGARTPFYVLAAESSHVVASATGNEGSLALRPGAYRATADERVLPQRFEVRPMASTVLPQSPLLWRDAAADGSALELHDSLGRLVLSLPSGRGNSFRFIGDPGSLTVVEAGSVRGELTPSVSGGMVLWRLSDGSLPLFDGLAVTFAENSRELLVPGAPVRLYAEVLEEVRAGVVLRQPGGGEWALGEVDLGPGVPFEVQVPADLDPGRTGVVSLSFPVAQGVLVQGRSEDLRVHQPLDAGVRRLRVVESGPTAVTIAWSPPEGREPAGYNVYRNQDARPANRGSPVGVPTFTDIGLSAGLRLEYRVCPVDAVGLEGPCDSVEAGTTEFR